MELIVVVKGDKVRDAALKSADYVQLDCTEDESERLVLEAGASFLPYLLLLLRYHCDWYLLYRLVARIASPKVFCFVLFHLVKV